jgi:hypothetical protein
MDGKSGKSGKQDSTRCDDDGLGLRRDPLRVCKLRRPITCSRKDASFKVAGPMHASPLLGLVKLFEGISASVESSKTRHAAVQSLSTAFTAAWRSEPPSKSHVEHLRSSSRASYCYVRASQSPIHPVFDVVAPATWRARW